MMDLYAINLKLAINTSFGREHLIKMHNGELKFLAQNRGTLVEKTSGFAPPCGPLPPISLEKENMIFLKDIQEGGPDMVHKGKFLICRSILPEVRQERSEALAAVVVDNPDGSLCLRIVLADFATTIRPGSILAIMHPWLVWCSTLKLVIHAAYPQLVHIFEGTEPLISDLVWKAPLSKPETPAENDPAWIGNEYFKEKNYPKAAEAYTKSIEAHPQVPKLYSNRALAYLKMDQPMLALQDTETGMNLDPTNLKLLYRKGKALIQLKRYEEAAEFLEKAGQENKEAMEDKAFADLVRDANRLVMEESKMGN